MKDAMEAAQTASISSTSGRAGLKGKWTGTYLLRKVLEPITLTAVKPDIGRPFLRAITSIDAIAMTSEPSSDDSEEGGSKPS